MTAVRDIPIDPMQKEERDRIQTLMQAAYIPGISIASVSPEGKIQAAALGVTNNESKSEVNPDTQFWACSLSKSVFAYLVIKLIEDGDLPPNFLEEKFILNGKECTPKMMLSHQTGLPNEGPPDEQSNKSTPGKVFRYSGEGYLHLQQIILQRIFKGENPDKNTLDKLAHEKVFNPLGMNRSSFSFPEKEPNLATTHTDAMTPNPIPKQSANNNNAAASLHTTASDYARFLMGCMSNSKFIEMITPQIHDMQNDIDSTVINKETKEAKVNKETLKPIDWGLGFGLQKDANGQVISAFHWGHGPGAKAFFSVNLKPPKSAVVYLTNSENGLAIAENIANPTVGNIAPTMKFLSEKYDYKKIDSPGWKEYHEHLIAAVAAEKNGHIDLAISTYNEALKIRPDKKNEIQYRIMWADAHRIRNDTTKTPNINLEDIAGEYGPLKIFVNGSKLQIDVGDPNGKHDLKIIDKNTLLDGDVIIKISSNGNDNNSSLRCYWPNGGVFPPDGPAPRITNFNKMTFEEFDQSEHGVRKLAKSADFTAAEDAITNYISANQEKLTPAQRCLLWFHAGQNAALSNKNDEAIKFFEKASETVPDERNPNQKKYALTEFVGPATEHYLKATIAFIKNKDGNNRESTLVIHEALNEIKKIPIEDYPHTNVVLIPGRVNDMLQAPRGTTYADVFKMEPSLPPLPGKTTWHRIHVPKDDPDQEGKLVGEYRSELEDALNKEKLVQSQFGQGSDTARRLRH